MGNHKRAIDGYLEAEKISNIPDWEIYFNLGMYQIFSSNFLNIKIEYY